MYVCLSFLLNHKHIALSTMHFLNFAFVFFYLFSFIISFYWLTMFLCEVRVRLVYENVLHKSSFLALAPFSFQGYSRLSHLLPLQPDGQSHTPGPTHLPPFMHMGSHTPTERERIKRCFFVCRPGSLHRTNELENAKKENYKY